MPIMTRMRDSMPVILFLLLIAFLVTIIFEWGMDYVGLRGQRTDELGSVNGQIITGKEFSDILKNYTDMQKAQTGADPTDEQMKELREQVWGAIVNQTLIAQEAARLGVKVTDQEIVDWVRGDNPPDELRRMFTDSTGQFQRQYLEQFLNNPNEVIRDPEGRDPNYGSRQLAQYEEGLRQRRLQEKIQSLVMASVVVSEGEVRQRFIEQNEKFSALYAAFDADQLVRDTNLTPTDDDLRRYYDENIERYRVEATRGVKYVLFPVMPSASDTSLRRDEIADVASKARSSVDFFELVSTYTDRPDSGAWFRRGEFSPRLEDSVFAARKGAIVGPVEENDELRVVKVLEERPAKEPVIRASHILFRLENDSTAVKSLAQQVLRDARAGKDFAALAGQYSKDPGSASRGGDLGWFGKGRMTPAFESAAFAAKPGSIVGPVRTPFGLHIIKVTGRDARELKVASVVLRIETSPQTRGDLLERARDFGYNARKTEFVKEAESVGLQVRDAQVQEKNSAIMGLGIEQSATRWIFKNSVGDVSEPFPVAQGYAVFTITDIKAAGVRPFEEVRESLRPSALRQKKIEKVKQIAVEVRSRLGETDSLTKLQQLDPSIVVRETGSFTIAAGAPGIGRDANFLGAVLGLAPGKISPVVESARGAYLVQVVSASGADSAQLASQRESLRSRLLQEKRSRHMSEWLEQLRAKADIEDRRDLYSF